MATVETVRGPIDTSEMGTTLMHEHVFVLTTEVQANLPEPWDPDRQIADAVAKLRRLVDIGVRTIVDPTVIGLGRDIATVQQINEQVDINIVVATGIYTYDSAAVLLPLPVHARGRARPDDRPLRARHHRGHRAYRGEGGVPQVRHRRAGHDAGRRAGAAGGGGGQPHDRGADHRPHPPRHQAGRRGGPGPEGGGRRPGQRRARPQRRHRGPDHLQQLADMGFFLGMDRFGIGDDLGRAGRVNTVVELCRRGYSGSMVLSHDASCLLDWLDNAARAFVLPKLDTTPTSTKTCCPSLREGGRHRRADRRHAGRSNPRRYFETRAA